MTIIKLKDAGDSHTALVTACEEVQGTYGPQMKFTLDNGDVIFVGDEPAKRQLARCGFPDDEAYERTVPDNILTFAREPNTSKKGAAPYWSITLAGKGDLRPAPSKRLTGPASPELPADGPPAHFKDIPLPESPEGDPDPLLSSPVIDAVVAQKRELIEQAYRWAVDTAMRAQNDLYIGEIAPTAESVQAGAATLLIQAEKRGAI